MSRIPVEHERAMVAAYLNGASAHDAAAQFGYYHATCIHALKKNGIERRDRYARRSQYQLNEAFFEQIDNEEKAYWLGFIAADGCVSLRDGYKLRIKLQYKDRGHLEKLLSALDADYKINDSFCNGRLYAGVEINSKNWLET